jgi:hypothetical protein
MESEPVRVRVRRWARARVRLLLRPRREEMDLTRAAWAGLRAQLLATERLVDAARVAHDRTPFHAAMTVHAAHLRHPAVAAAFARRGLPGCPACAVGADETLLEAAYAEGFDVTELVAELNRTLGVS